jgi:hypothetical protein
MRGQGKNADDKGWSYVIAVRESILDGENEGDAEPKAKEEKK